MITYLSKTVGDLMTSELVSVKPNTLMTKVARIFDANNFHHLPVLNDEGICEGVISKIDYYQVQDCFTRLDGKERDFSNNKFLSSLLASEVMTKNPVSIDYNVDIRDLIPIFIANSVHSVIVTKNGKCIGIITPLDLLKYMQVILVSYQKAIV